METLLFSLFSGVAIVCALVMVASKKAVTSAVSLVAVMFCMAALFALQDAHLLAALQVLVYAGAIMVLFLFVIMLLNLREKGGLLTGRQPIVQLGCVLFFSTLLVPLVMSYQAIGTGELPAGFGSTAEVGALLYTDYLLPFEIASVLLLAALVGAVVLTKTKARGRSKR